MPRYANIGVCACPVCGNTLDAAVALDDDDDPMPSPGDLSLCGRCLTCLVFEDHPKVEDRRVMRVAHAYEIAAPVVALAKRIKQAKDEGELP